MSQHILPRTTIFYIWHRITSRSVCLPPPFHTTSWSTYSTSHSTPHLTHSQHHSTCHTIPFHSTIRIYTTTSWFYITPPRLTSQHIASYTSDIAQQSQHITIPHHIPTSRTFPQLALCNIPHHTILHITVTFCISIAFHITPRLKLQQSTSHHITPKFHLAPRHAHQSPHSN